MPRATRHASRTGPQSSPSLSNSRDVAARCASPSSIRPACASLPSRISCARRSNGASSSHCSRWPAASCGGSFWTSCSRIAAWLARKRRRWAVSQPPNCALRSISNPCRKSPANRSASSRRRSAVSFSTPALVAAATSSASTAPSPRSSRTMSALASTRRRPGPSTMPLTLLRHQRSSPRGSSGTSHSSSQRFAPPDRARRHGQVGEEGTGLPRARQRHRHAVPDNRQRPQQPQPKTAAGARQNPRSFPRRLPRPSPRAAPSLRVPRFRRCCSAGAHRTIMRGLSHHGYGHRHHAPRPRPRRGQGPPEGRVVLGRLCRRRHHAADRGRVLVRGPGHPRRAARARRRGRQRQCRAGRRTPLVRRGRHRLRAGPARARARACRCRSAANRVPRGRCRSPALRGWQLRRRGLDLRGDVHPQPGARRGRAPARLPARRQDRARQLDPARLHRPALQDDRRLHAAARRCPPAVALGHARAPGRAVRAARSLDPGGAPATS